MASTVSQHASSGTNYGVFGESDSSSGYGVYGIGNTGVRGWGTGSIGVSGTSGAVGGTGVRGSGNGYDFYAAGGGTNYGPFTGAHEVRLSVSFPTVVQAGLIVSATGEAHIRRSADGGVGISSTLPTVRLADTAEDKAVLGALVAEVTLPEDHWYTRGRMSALPQSTP